MKPWRTFEQFPKGHGTKCPVCGTDDEGETILVPIDGTQDGGICQAQPTHTKCLMSEGWQLSNPSPDTGKRLIYRWL